MKDVQLELFPYSLISSEALDMENPAFLSKQIITYIGNKRKLLNFIAYGLDKIKLKLKKKKLDSFDVFSGSGIVARFLKQHSSSIVCCDIEKYSEAINKCYLANKEKLDINSINQAINWINNEALINPSPGFIAELYSPADDNNVKKNERVFYTYRNACFLDTARQLIDKIDATIRPFVIAPLLYKASVHANTSGVFKGFYKNSETGIGQFGGNGKDALSRILGEIIIPMPIFSNYSCKVKLYQGDINKLIDKVPLVDVAYIDPPYNQHPYGSNYFMLNLILNYKSPTEISPISGIPKNWNRSDYNKRNRAKNVFADLVNRIKAKYLLISFNSEGFISYNEMLSILNEIGHVETLETKYNVFRGSRNLRARDLYTKEYLYLVEKR